MTPDEMKARSRGHSVDMSPEAIAHRINIVSELRAAMIALEKARPAPGIAPQPETASQPGRMDSGSPDAPHIARGGWIAGSGSIPGRAAAGK